MNRTNRVSRYISIEEKIEESFDDDDDELEFAAIDDYDVPQKREVSHCSTTNVDVENRGYVLENGDYVVEFIEEMHKDTPKFDGTDEADESMKNSQNLIELDDNVEDDFESHAMVLRHAKNTKTDTFFCLKCQIEYATLDDFKVAHYSATQQEEHNTDSARQTPSDEALDLDNYFYTNDTAGSYTRSSLEVENIEPEEMEIEEQHLDEQFEKDTEADAVVETETDIGNVNENEESNADVQADVENEKLFFCSECESIFSDIQSAEQHYCTDSTKEDVSTSMNASKKIFKCQYCPKHFANLKSLAMHCRIHRPSRKERPARPATVEHATCTICNTTFHSEKNLKLHMKIHKKRKDKTIEEAIPSAVKTEYKNHNKFFCQICKKFFDQQLLTVHQSMHMREETYVCGICNREYDNRVSYEMHMKVHSQKEPVMRPSKSKRLDSQKIQFPCQYCGRQFPRPHEKVRHERVHTGEKPYACEVCGKCFRVPYSLTLHLRTHTEIRPYHCTTCNKRFKSHSVYAHHVKTHSSERAYKCDLCEKAFRTSVQLCAHKNSHVKPFNCSECNRPFSSLYAVREHMKSHTTTDDKQKKQLKHSCNICGAVYAREFSLRGHMRNQHGIEPHEAAMYVAKKNTIAARSNALNDEDAAALIAAATEADENDEYVIADHGDGEAIDEQSYLNQQEISSEAILQHDEIIVDSFQEVEDTDWLAK